ncbi:MAG TPA: bifunctional 5,10-methylenetetrahydrofolate dehydrogenase/5,10-methenyltetrahydrofolate cyclohydrolase, partial [Bacillota bacterium]|nr:bifunctional 5,10-methylenetetrahydrofolate dehydrogenase/5,10-methenyltetrahydrofolate cyclohydrolase [Bacillota bacterium]
MSATIIDGKAVAAEIREGLKLEVEAFKGEFGREPGLAVVIVGEDPASRTYVNSKKKGCAELGMYSEEHTLPEQTTQAELESLVRKLNLDPRIDGILVQLPLPKHIDADAVISTIDPKKDVDGFHPVNIGNLLIGRPCLKSCTPAGIMELIKRSGVDLTGKHAVVVGRSNIVGKPVSVLLLEKHATVTICHSRTKDLAGMCRMADVLVAAVGKARIIKGDWVKPGAVVIDVGTNKVEGSKKLVGDVDF